MNIKIEYKAINMIFKTTPTSPTASVGNVRVHFFARKQNVCSV
jgi:hypothetical protein